MKAFTVALSFASLAAIAFAGPMKRQSFPIQDVIDDADDTVSYSEGWTHLTNQGNIDHSGTESYSNGRYAWVSFPVPEQEGDSVSYNLTIYAGKKNDRGTFNVFAEGAWIGQGDEYDPSAKDATNTQVVFRQTGITLNGQGNFNLTNAGYQYFDFDYAVIEYNAP